MFQQDRHLTTEQLSAFLDRQLTPDEEQSYRAHLAACQRCAQSLAGLRQTVGLLKALPLLEVPRSFELPLDIEKQSVRLEATRAARSASTPTLARTTQPQLALHAFTRRSMGVLSALAAVVGILFLLSSFSALFPGPASPSASQTAKESPAGTVVSPTVPPALSPHSGATEPGIAGITPTPTASGPIKPFVRQSGQGTQAQPPGSSQGSPGSTSTSKVLQSETWPVILFFHLSRPEGRLGFGLLLLIFGLPGCILFIRRRRQRKRLV